jgi:hypothetical protein
MAVVQVTAKVVVDDSGIHSQIPILINEHGVINSLVDYILGLDDWRLKALRLRWPYRFWNPGILFGPERRGWLSNTGYICRGHVVSSQRTRLTRSIVFFPELHTPSIQNSCQLPKG